MLPTVELDDQPRGVRDEIDDVWTDRLLAAELLTREATGAEAFPEAAFGVGHFFAKLTGEVAARAAPLPNPPPQGGGDK
jgi:hypothetical protein